MQTLIDSGDDSVVMINDSVLKPFSIKDSQSLSDKNLETMFVKFLENATKGAAPRKANRSSELDNE